MANGYIGLFPFAGQEFVLAALRLAGRIAKN
jgi:hypothetical protein